MRVKSHVATVLAASLYSLVEVPSAGSQEILAEDELILFAQFVRYVGDGTCPAFVTRNSDGSPAILGRSAVVSDATCAFSCFNEEGCVAFLSDGDTDRFDDRKRCVLYGGEFPKDQKMPPTEPADYLTSKLSSCYLRKGLVASLEILDTPHSSADASRADEAARTAIGSPQANVLGSTERTDRGVITRSPWEPSYSAALLPLLEQDKPADTAKLRNVICASSYPTRKLSLPRDNIDRCLDICKYFAWDAATGCSGVSFIFGASRDNCHVHYGALLPYAVPHEGTGVCLRRKTLPEDDIRCRGDWSGWGECNRKCRKYRVFSSPTSLTASAAQSTPVESWACPIAHRAHIVMRCEDRACLAAQRRGSSNEYGVTVTPQWSGDAFWKALDTAVSWWFGDSDSGEELESDQSAGAALPQDCVGHWISSECDENCFQTKVFDVLSEARNGGQPCGYVDGQETRVACADCVPADQACEGIWGKWSPCSEECLQERFFSVTTARRGNGKRCPFPDGAIDLRYCTGGGCRESAAVIDQPVKAADCVGEWSIWSRCSKTCEKRRTFNVIRPAFGSGRPCYYQSGMVESQGCIGHDCYLDVNCYGRWGAWGVCQANCTQRREYTIYRPQSGKGLKCPERNGAEEFRDCKGWNCVADKDCEGVWDWVEPICPFKCERTKVFHVTSEPRGTGKKCESDDGTKEVLPCTGGHCSKDCEGEYSRWSRCSANCTQSRLFTVTQAKEGKGKECEQPHLNRSSRPCEGGECPVDSDCEGEWSDWSMCDQVCEQSRRYRITSPASGKGQSCPYKEGALESRSCSDGEGACINVDCSGEWSSWSGCDPGDCMKSRRYTVLKPKGGIGNDCPVPDREEQSRRCSEAECEAAKEELRARDCLGEWSPWTKCSSTCRKSRRYFVQRRVSTGGKPCEFSPGEVQKKNCEDKEDECDFALDGCAATHSTNCHVTKCCRDPRATCLEKDDEEARCLLPGDYCPSANGPEELSAFSKRSPWTCRNLTRIVANPPSLATPRVNYLQLRIIDMELESLQYPKTLGNLMKAVKNSVGTAVGVNPDQVEVLAFLRGSTVAVFDVLRDKRERSVLEDDWRAAVTTEHSPLHLRLPHTIDRFYPPLMSAEQLRRKYLAPGRSDIEGRDEGDAFFLSVMTAEAPQERLKGGGGLLAAPAPRETMRKYSEESAPGKDKAESSRRKLILVILFVVAFAVVAVLLACLLWSRCSKSGRRPEKKGPSTLKRRMSDIPPLSPMDEAVPRLVTPAARKPPPLPPFSTYQSTKPPATYASSGGASVHRKPPSKNFFARWWKKLMNTEWDADGDVENISVAETAPDLPQRELSMSDMPPSPTPTAPPAEVGGIPSPAGPPPLGSRALSPHSGGSLYPSDSFSPQHISGPRMSFAQHPQSPYPQATAFLAQHAQAFLEQLASENSNPTYTGGTVHHPASHCDNINRRRML